MQYFTCFADALAFRGRSLVLRKAQRILAFLVLNPHWQIRYRLRFHAQITESRGLIIPWSEVNLLRDISSTLFTYKVRGVKH